MIHVGGSPARPRRGCFHLPTVAVVPVCNRKRDVLWCLCSAMALPSTARGRSGLCSRHGAPTQQHDGCWGLGGKHFSTIGPVAAIPSFNFAWHERLHPRFRKDLVRLLSRTLSCLKKAGHVTVGLHAGSCQVGTHRLFPASTTSPAFIPEEEGPESPLPRLGAPSCPSPLLSHAGLHSHWLLETQGSYSSSDGCGEMGRGCRKD